MSVRLLFSKFPRNVFEKAVCNAIVTSVSRNFSRKLSNKENSYKPVKPRKTLEEGNPDHQFSYCSS